MSEKGFTIKSTATELELYDNGVKIGEFPHYEWVARPVDYVVKTLNEQQKTIKKQDIEIQSLNLHIEKLVDGDEISQLLMREYEISDGLEKENKELKKQLKKKNTTNMQLREINKDLGDDLHNCRLNKNIISEKLKLWQDTLAEYDIYTINDFKELMKNE